MIKLILKILVLIILLLGAVLLVRDDPGILMIRYRDYSLDTSLAFGLVAVFIAVVILHYCLNFIRGLLRLPANMKQQSKARRLDKSRKQFTQGLIDMAEGRFEQAENNLLRLVDHSESPLIHYLAAARAAQLQGKHVERDSYLQAAHEARPEAEIAIGVTQAELQLAHKQTEQALATLTHLHSIAPKHDYVSMLLARAYFELEDWQALVELLPDVRRKDLLKTSRLEKMEHAGYRGMLEEVASKANLADFEKAWHKIPKARQADAALIGFYLELMVAQGWQSESAERSMIKSIEQTWSNQLVDIYGRFNSRNNSKQLALAEKWLEDWAQNEVLLLALGRIAIRANLWGKAQSFLEASIGAKATPAACLELAELFESQLQQKETAAGYYKRGLKLSLEASNH